MKAFIYVLIIFFLRQYRLNFICSFWEFCCAAGFGMSSAWTDYIRPEMLERFSEIKQSAGQRREELFREMQQIAWDDAAQLYLVYLDVPIGLRNHVRGFHLPPTRHYYLETVYLEDPAAARPGAR